jgi:hypothetical protein
LTITDKENLKMKKLTPAWKIPTKPARDVSGYNRGERGYGEADKALSCPELRLRIFLRRT